MNIAMPKILWIPRVVVPALVACISPALVYGQVPDLSQLDAETRSSIEVACVGAYTQGPAAYRDCVTTQLASIEGVGPAPDLSQLDRETRSSIEVACVGAHTQGPAPYRKCVTEQLASIGISPVASVATAPPESEAPNSAKSLTHAKSKPKAEARDAPRASSSDHRSARTDHGRTQENSSMPPEMWIVLVILIGLLAVYLIPIIWVLVSGRSRGGAKFGWLIVVLFFSWIGLALFLIVTQPPRKQTDGA